MLFIGLEVKKISMKKIVTKPMLLAFYYPWYGNPTSSNSWVHWANVSYNSIGTATHYPLLGPYDSQDENLIEAHIKLAKAFGIDGFVCSWWGIGTFEDNAFSKIVNVANKENFNVTIYYESVRNISKEQIVNELSYVLKTYSSQPSFLKLDGKPVIFIYAVGAYGRTPDFWKSVIEEVYNRTKIEAIYIADTFDVSYLSIFDGLHTYNPIWINDFNSTYTSEAKIVKAAGKIWVVTVSPGYDDRKIRHPGSYVSRENGAHYEETWKGALASNPDMILICTFNEWHEGTEIEPSREYGFKYMELTRTFAEIFKKTKIESPPSPKINLELVNSSNMLLNISNVGVGDAIAISLVVSYGSATLKPVSNILSLPVNDSSTCLFIPMLKSKQSISIPISFTLSKETKVNFTLTYYSLNGEKFVTEKEAILKTSQGQNLSIFIFPTVAILLIIFLLFLLRRKIK